MTALYFLIPMSLLILGGAVLVFMWSLKRGHYEDMESPAHRILIDDREERARFDEADSKGNTPPPGDDTRRP